MKQRVLYYKSNHCIVLESESVTHGVIYCDYFTVKNRFCITKCTNKRRRLQITSFINYTQKPNFIAKSKLRPSEVSSPLQATVSELVPVSAFIERNTMGALKDSYNYLGK